MFEDVFNFGQGPGPLADVGAALADPRIQGALLQFGLNAMQPVAMGQTQGGHLAQAVGAAGEAVNRADQTELKNLLAEAKLDRGIQGMDIARQRLDLSRQRAARTASRPAPGTMTEYQRAQLSRQGMKDYEKSIDAEAKNIEKRATSLIPEEAAPYAEYKGKSFDQIKTMLKQKKPYKAGQAYSSSEDTDDDAGDDEALVDPAALPQQSAAPAPGAKRAPDGNWYVPDPKRPGKFLKVNP
jgi:hypothetical protein